MKYLDCTKEFDWSGAQSLYAQESVFLVAIAMIIAGTAIAIIAAMRG